MSEGVGTNENGLKTIARRHPVHFKGLHGWVEYLPTLKIWQWTLKLIFSHTSTSHAPTRAEAELKLKEEINVVAHSKHVRSVD